jgi:multicomponent Na+:H+ antiporter subunit B
MISLILRTATRFLMPVLLLFSLFLLLRGHNEPGGGFAGGLVAAAAFALHSIAYNAAATRQALWLNPQTLIGTGLLLAAGSSTLSLLLGQSFMTGQWGYLHLPETGAVTLGTPMLFDIGVYLVVMGVTLLIILSLSEA